MKARCTSTSGRAASTTARTAWRSRTSTLWNSVLGTKLPGAATSQITMLSVSSRRDEPVDEPRADVAGTSGDQIAHVSRSSVLRLARILKPNGPPPNLSQEDRRAGVRNAAGGTSPGSTGPPMGPLFLWSASARRRVRVVVHLEVPYARGKKAGGTPGGAGKRKRSSVAAGQVVGGVATVVCVM